MLPQSVLSSEVIAAAFAFPRNIPKEPLTDYEMGGINIEDASAGLRMKVWRGQLIGDDIVLDAESIAPVTVLTVEHITEFAFTFDQAMRLFITYQTEEFESFFYWYDTTIPGYRTSQLPAQSYTPRCSLDDNRPLEGQTSDIILAYTRAGSLYFRAQRDRYETEYELSDTIGVRGLIQIGMNVKNRFQFQLTTS